MTRDETTMDDGRRITYYYGSAAASEAQTEPATGAGEVPQPDGRTPR